MSIWTRRLHETDENIAEDLANSPSGGRWKMFLLGIVLALIPIWYGIRCLQINHATIVGRAGARLEVNGSTATAMAIVYLAVGLFMHAHWFWGLHPKLEPLSPVLKVLSLLAFIGAFGYAACHILAV